MTTNELLREPWLRLCRSLLPWRHTSAGTPLTDIEVDLIATNVLGLQSALKVWKRKNGILAGLLLANEVLSRAPRKPTKKSKSSALGRGRSFLQQRKCLYFV